MNPDRVRRWLYALLLLAFLLHNDLWLWSDARLVFGLPVGLTYHIALCLVASVILWLLVRFAWPPEADDGEPEESKP